MHNRNCHAEANSPVQICSTARNDDFITAMAQIYMSVELKIIHIVLSDLWEIVLLRSFVCLLFQKAIFQIFIFVYLLNTYISRFM